jgi:hypothetical protein
MTDSTTKRSEPNRCPNVKCGTLINRRWLQCPMCDEKLGESKYRRKGTKAAR